MITVPLSFHQKAQGQVIEPKGKVMVSFEKNSSLIGGDTEYYGSSSQTTYSGKNLLNYTTRSGKSSTGDVELGVGVIKITQTTTNVGGNCFVYFDVKRPDLAGQQVTFSTKATAGDGSTGTRVRFTKISTSTEIASALYPISTGSSRTFTVPSDGEMRMYFYANASNVTGVVGAYSEYTEVQLEVGSQPTSFQEYYGGYASPNPLYPQQIENVVVGNTELCKIGTYQDSIYKSGNVWYVHKEVGKINMKDYKDKSWYISQYSGNSYVVKCLKANLGISDMMFDAGSSVATQDISNYFTATPTTELYQGTTRVGFGITTDGMYFSNNSWSVNDFKNFINTHDVFVYYRKNAPTTTPITDQATLAFLEQQDVGYFTLDQSLLDGTSLLGSSEDNPIQLWDTYDYTDYTDRLVSVDMEHSFEFPYSVQSAVADFVFENTDNYFTPTRGSVIDEYNLPRRPIKIYAGFAGETVVPQFVGITEGMVDIDEKKAVAKYTAYDFLTEIAELTLDNTIAMRNVRTNEVLAKIVEQFGVLPSQYNFENGDNIIPFVFFDKGQNAGEAIRKLVQAEAGRFWLDEMGILRFQKRYTTTQQPMITLPEYSIVSVKPSGANKIVNHINITCDLREVQEYQTVYTKKGTGDSTSNLWVVDAGATITRQCSLEDPCYDVQLPTLGHATSVSWFTALTAGGVEVTEGITTTGELSTNAYTVTFTNSNDFAVEIDEIELWGEPAKVYDVLEYDSYDDESVEKYGEQLLEINDNQFFQSFNQAQNFAVYTLSERANYNANLDLTIKGDFSLQLGDYIEIEGDYAGAYVIDSIKWHLGVGNLETTLKVHKYTPVEYFTLDVSRLDGTDVLA